MERGKEGERGREWKKVYENNSQKKDLKKINHPNGHPMINE